MSPNWDDVIARARGLATHLLDAGRLAALARAESLPLLAKALERDRFRVGTETIPASAQNIEAAIRRHEAGRLRLLARWCGPRAAQLAVLFEDDDRRNLGLLARGAVEGTASATRLRGVLPTPSLPERALNELAALPHPADMGALLASWEHPYAAPLLATSREGPTDLFRLECDLARRYAERATAAGRTGDHTLRRYIAGVIDQENLLTAMVATEDPALKPAEVFLPGGRQLTRDRFERALGQRDQIRVRAFLAATIKEGPLAAGLRGRGPGSLEETLLRATLKQLESERRLDPLGSAGIIAFALGVRLESMVLQRIVWGIALGAPPAVRFAEGAGAR